MSKIRLAMNELIFKKRNLHVRFASATDSERSDIEKQIALLSAEVDRLRSKSKQNYDIDLGMWSECLADNNP